MKSIESLPTLSPRSQPIQANPLPNRPSLNSRLYRYTAKINPNTTATAVIAIRNVRRLNRRIELNHGRTAELAVKPTRNQFGIWSTTNLGVRYAVNPKSR